MGEDLCRREGWLRSPGLEPLHDHGFPGLLDHASYLLLAEFVPLQLAFGPPLLPGPVTMKRFSEQLITVADQGLGIDLADLDRPNSPIAGGVGQIAGAIGIDGEDEDAPALAGDGVALVFGDIGIRLPWS